MIILLLIFAHLVQGCFQKDVAVQKPAVQEYFKCPEMPVIPPCPCADAWTDAMIKRAPLGQETPRIAHMKNTYRLKVTNRSEL